MADDGANNFVQLLQDAMQQHGINQTTLAALLGVSQAAVNRWLKGKEPSPTMRRVTLETLKAKAKPAVVPGLVDVSLAGEGISLTMRVSQATARRMLQLLIGGTE
jgi:predicted transcriptional regulator